jgi:hypothetical protein
MIVDMHVLITSSIRMFAQVVQADNPIFRRLVDIINFLSVGVTVVVTGLIIVAGIQYVTAGGVPQRIEAAKKRIVNALMALFLFIFMYAISSWLIPGGIFNPGVESPVCNGGVCVN